MIFYHLDAYSTGISFYILTFTLLKSYKILRDEQKIIKQMKRENNRYFDV